MSIVIGTNMAATLASSHLQYSSQMAERSLNRLSSGLRIMNPSDDAGGLAVSMKLSAAAERAAAAQNNVGNTSSYLQQQDGVLASAAKSLDRISALLTLYQDPTKTADDKASYDAEYKTLQQGLAGLVDETFNNVRLFGASGSGVVENVKTSEDGAQSVAITAKDLGSSVDGIGALADSSGAGSLGALTLDTVNTAVANVATMRANNGAEQSRLGFASEILTTKQVNLQAANSLIMDVDVAQESTSLAHWNILVQSGAAMLAQANQNAQLALTLIR